MKSIARTAGRYSITEAGLVYSHPKESRGKYGAWLRPFMAGRSRKYSYVSLCIDGERKTIAVHKLVYETYIGPLIPEMEIGHKDKNRENNHWANLEQVTIRVNRARYYGLTEHLA